MAPRDRPTMAQTTRRNPTRPRRTVLSPLSSNVADPAYEPFEQLRIPPSPPITQGPDNAGGHEPFEVSTGYHITSAVEVSSRPPAEKEQSSMLLQRSWGYSSSIERIDGDVSITKKNTSSKSIASLFGFGKKTDESDVPSDRQQAALSDFGSSRQTKRTNGNGIMGRFSRTPTRTSTLLVMKGRLSVKPLPDVPPDATNSLTSSSNEMGFQRFVRNQIQSRKTVNEKAKEEPENLKVDTPKTATRVTRFTTGLRDSVFGLLGQAKDDDRGNKLGNLAETDKKRFKQSNQRQVRSMGVSHEMLRDLAVLPPRKRNKSLTELSISNPVLVEPPSYKALLTLEEAQNDPLIRRRTQLSDWSNPEPVTRSVSRNVASQLTRLTQDETKVTGTEICEPWMLEALRFDEGKLVLRDLKGRCRDREKAPTPSQEIIIQTKASWTTEQMQDKRPNRNSQFSGMGRDHQSLITRSQTVQRKSPMNASTASLSPLWSDSHLTQDASKNFDKQPLLRNSYSRRQTQTFHEVPKHGPSRIKRSDDQSHKTSRRLQAVTGVPFADEDNQRQGNAIQYRLIQKEDNEIQPILARASSVLPVHYRRESSVYRHLEGPTTPPPRSPLPAIPTSNSLTSCRSSTTKASLIYTPTSPIPTLSTSASNWSWKLNADSPASQLLNEMKNATGAAKAYRPDTLPTKRHVQQRSITSSLSSAGLLDDAVTKERPKRYLPVNVSECGKNDISGPNTTTTLYQRSNARSISKMVTGASAMTLNSEAPHPDVDQRDQKDDGSQSPDTTNNSVSVGTPSSIVNLYTSRS